MKKAKRGTELERWIDAQYRKDPGLKQRVDLGIQEMLIEEELVALRRERGLSQRQLAKLIGVTQPVIARIEAGNGSNFRIRTLARIAEVLGARVRIVFEKKSSRAKPSNRRLAKTA